MIQCCRFCTPETGRTTGCHATCQAYLKAQEKHIAEKRMISSEKRKNGQILGYFSDDKERRRRRYS